METKFKPFDRVLVRDNVTDEWKNDFFRYYYKGITDYPYNCVGGNYRQCIPFEGNEHLLGTTDDYEEPFEPKDGDFVTFGYGNRDHKPIQIFKCKRGNTHSAYLTLSVCANDSGYAECLYSENTDWGNYNLSLATEEEKQTLLNALHEKGKDWDAEKKEIVDYKWKPKHGDLVYVPHIRYAEIIPFEDRWDKDSSYLFNYLYKGWMFQSEEECQSLCDKLSEAIKNVK